MEPVVANHVLSDKLGLLGAAKIQYSTPAVSFQLTVTWLSPGTTLMPPSGGGGVTEVEDPPQAATKTAETKASMNARIECKDMNIPSAEALDPKF
ncbi:MAG: hypothetical protein EB002_02730 [Betaproteobacteria bacterium]|nr:hypothetical protein [Betaproteobacteria bacterium]NDE23941.1 hypothetical protein [Betaproteobacteria bacterium]